MTLLGELQNVLGGLEILLTIRPNCLRRDANWRLF